MRFKVILIVIPLLIILGACNSEEGGLDGAEAFSSKEKALNHFLGEGNTMNGIERIKTINDEVLLVRRSGNDHYSVYGIVKEDSYYSVQKLSATFALNNINGGGFEINAKR